MKKTFVLLLVILSLVACSSENGDADPTPLERKGAPVSFSIAVPTVSSTRIADPGSDAGEHDSWDHLLIIVAYTKKEQGTVFPDDDKKRMVYYDTFTKTEFDSCKTVEHTNSLLSPDTDHDGYHDFTMYLPTGDCYVYGITYSEGCGFNPVAVLDDIARDGKDHNADITGMQITNDYATGKTDQVAKMVSVATGYATYVDTSDPTSELNGYRLLHISLDKENEMKQYWRMTLTRLATKVDIQWDAQSAYEPATSTGDVTYTDVRINQFVFHGGADATTGSGYGRLFPALAAQAAGQTLTPVGGNKTFLNTSEISRRNGRVYHYTFPDGTNSKKITFSLVTSTDIVKDKPKTSNYTFDLTNLSGGFRRATWYKINVSIVGTKKKDGTVTISAFN